ncbi:hypothetical protein FRC12_002028 [Ceratobasidium sp. 428]|nr:hypothetical protein FRC12_002028 [Ceratobasidium sp. 428]
MPSSPPHLSSGVPPCPPWGQPRDKGGRFASSRPPANPGASLLTPLTGARPTLDPVAATSAGSTSPSLSSILALDSSEPVTPDRTRTGIPFPSPAQDDLDDYLPPQWRLFPATPTPVHRPNRSSRPRRNSEPTRSQTPEEPPARPTPLSIALPPLSIPKAAMTDPNADIRAARRALSDLAKFADEGDPMSEAEWRREFLIATREVSNKQRASLWEDHLAYSGEAYQWLASLKTAGTATDDWTTLLPLIESRWPTPSQDTDAYEERNRTRFGESYLDVESMAKALNDRQNPSRPHQVWAKQHLAKGKACDSTDKDRVYHTIERSLPRFVIGMLPKKSRYGSDFDGLCKDIGDLPARELYDAWAQASTLKRLEEFSLNPVVVTQPSYTPKPRRSSFRTERESSVPASLPSSTLSPFQPFVSSLSTSTSSLAPSTPTARPSDRTRGSKYISPTPYNLPPFPRHPFPARTSDLGKHRRIKQRPPLPPFHKLNLLESLTRRRTKHDITPNASRGYSSTRDAPRL